MQRKAKLNKIDSSVIVFQGFDLFRDNIKSSYSNKNTALLLTITGSLALNDEEEDRVEKLNMKSFGQIRYQK